MKRRVRIRETHDLEFLGWILLIFLGLLLAWASRAAALPDSRAWEQVSPINKGGGFVPGIDGSAGGGILQSTPDGDAITYPSLTAFPFTGATGTPIGSQYIARRGAQSWSTENITAPTANEEYPPTGGGAPYKAFSEDLSSSLLYLGQVGELPGEPKGYRDYRVRDDQTGTYQPLLTSFPREAGETIMPAGAFNLQLESATPDLEHVVIATDAALTPGSTSSGNEFEPSFYEWTDGHLEPISVPPGAAKGETVPAEWGTETSPGHVVSDDGSRVFWSSTTVGSGALYVRENIGRPQSPYGPAPRYECLVPTDACTVEVDESQGGEGESGHGVFMTASNDGSRVFFTDGRRLTPKSSAHGFGREDLYEFDVDTHQLVDLTVDEADPEGAEVQGVLGASGDGTYVYFVARGALPQAQASADGQPPTYGKDNLYLAHAGSVRFIATLSPEDNNGVIAEDWNPSLYGRTTRVSGDGNLVFMSQEPLTDYDNVPAAGRSCAPHVPRCKEVFLYDAGTARLSCVSCNPSGEPPAGPASIPAGTGTELNKAIYQSRVLSEGLPGNGARVFFDSPDGLVSQDTNGREDVYEWEQPGVGSCTMSSAAYSATSGGCVGLISGGTYAEGSSFVDASTTGDNVFFVTGQQLVSQDNDQLADLYDARENGGFPEPAVPPACSGTGCQGVPPPPPIFATPSSGTFEGVEAPPVAAVVKPAVKGKQAKPKAKGCKKGFVKRQGRCVRKPKARKAAREKRSVR